MREESDGSGGGSSSSSSSFERYKSGMQDRNKRGSTRGVYPFINPLSNRVERIGKTGRRDGAVGREVRWKAAIIQPDHDS